MCGQGREYEPTHHPFSQGNTLTKGVTEEGIVAFHSVEARIEETGPFLKLKKGQWGLQRQKQSAFHVSMTEQQQQRRSGDLAQNPGGWAQSVATGKSVPLSDRMIGRLVSLNHMAAADRGGF